MMSVFFTRRFCRAKLRTITSKYASQRLTTSARFRARITSLLRMRYRHSTSTRSSFRSSSKTPLLPQSPYTTKSRQWSNRAHSSGRGLWRTHIRRVLLRTSRSLPLLVHPMTSRSTITTRRHLIALSRANSTPC